MTARLLAGAGLLLMLAAARFAADVAPTAENLEEVDFLSYVRYISSTQENREYKNLPAELRAEFIRDFWEIRDPDPTTPENEFRNEYRRRIDEANRRFTAGREGWLTDRGKTYILLGPPQYVEAYPLGIVSANPLDQRPAEVWHYPDCQVLFVDKQDGGEFPVQYTSLENQADIHRAFMQAKRNLFSLRGSFTFQISSGPTDGGFALKLTLDPRQLVFREQNDRMVAGLTVGVRLLDANRHPAWSYEGDHDIKLVKGGRIAPVRIRLLLPPALPHGVYSCLASVAARESAQKTYQRIKITVK
jgi:GWxTD domain-containing protein